jgi:hypothetical protein
VMHRAIVREMNGDYQFNVWYCVWGGSSLYSTLTLHDHLRALERLSTQQFYERRGDPLDDAM